MNGFRLEFLTNISKTAVHVMYVETYKNTFHQG